MTKAMEARIHILREVMRVTRRTDFIFDDREPLMQDLEDKAVFLKYWKQHGFHVRHKRNLGYLIYA